MPFMAILLLISFNLLAIDVATIDLNKASPNEISLIMTDKTFQAAMENHFVAKSCKARVSMNSTASIREINFHKVCRAEVIQFLLNNGYKANPYFKTFIK